MDNLKKYTEIIEQALAKIEMGRQPARLYDPLYYALDTGGKRIRPVICLLACRAFGAPAEKALPPALAAEVFHNFTLLHDDIMDNAPVRRGRPSVHAKWGANTALLSGDVMLVRAYEILGQTENQYFTKIFSLFNQCAAEVCEGQQEDMLFEERQEVGEEEYLEMIRKKTAVLLGFCGQAGAICAGAGPEDAEKVRDFFTLLGIGFQITDDYLDTFGNPEKFGKKVGGDIIEGKKTLLYIEALKSPGAEEFAKLYAETTLPEAEKVSRISELLRRSGADQRSLEKAQSYFDRAEQILEKTEMQTEGRALFRAFAKMLSEREN